MSDAAASFDAVVVGAGITGAATAYRLSRAGLRVAVVDRHGPAAMASGWTLAGVRQSGRHPAELPLARHAVARWPALADALGAPTGYRQEGNLRLARSEAEVAHIERMVREQRSLGLELDFLEGNAAVRELAPALADHVLAASFCPTDGHAEPVATVQAFLGAAERLGATMRFGERAHALVLERNRFVGIDTTRGRVTAGLCVLAAGIAVGELLEPHGLSVPLTVPMVTVLQTEPLPPVLGPVLGVADASCAVRQQIDGRLRATDGGSDWHGDLVDGEGGPRVPVTMAGVGRVIERVGSILPLFREARLARSWCGLLDLTPDALPVLDRAPGIDGLIVAAGFSGHGFGIGPAVGEILGDLALGREPELPIAPFAYDRSAIRDGGEALEPATLHG